MAKDDFVTAQRSKDPLLTSHSNTRKGIIKFIGKLPSNAWCIMEATGVYSVRLAMALHEKDFRVSVINPLQIKRFAQTKLKRAKTDRVDAVLIAEYGEKMQPDLFKPSPAFIHQLQQKRTLLKQLFKTRTAFSNQLHALQHLPDPDNETIKSCMKIVSNINTQICKVELQMEQLAIEHCEQLFKQLKTIPGISTKAALELIIVSGMFRNFKSHKQFSAFIGICPSINESGKTIRGYRGISRIGSSHTRAILYMCTLNAFRYNKQCKILYDRLTAAGKPSKVALMAVANKLIRQVFGMVSSGSQYNPDYEVNFV